MTTEPSCTTGDALTDLFLCIGAIIYLIITAHRVLFVHTIGRLLRAELETCKMVTNNDLLLLDSGAQYIDGTTDVTRTFHTGTPTDYQVSETLIDTI